MNKRSSLFIGVAICCFAGFSGGAVLAQDDNGLSSSSEPIDDAQGMDPNRLEEIVVTASRREQTLQDAPVSITAINPDEMSIGGLTAMRDIVGYAPGVNTHGGESRGPGRQTITMRGVTQTQTTPTVGTYLDDIPLGSGGSFAQGDVLMMDMVKSNLERVEIIRGPQGTLYGASSMGGVVRYITPDPSVQDVRGNILTDASSTSHGGVNYQTRVAMNLPLIPDRLGVSFSGFFSREAGFIDRDEMSVSGEARNVDASDFYGGMIKAVGNFSDALQGSAIYARSDAEYEGINSIDLAGPPFEPVAGKFLSLQGEADNETFSEIVGGTLEYDLGWASLLSSTSYQEARYTAISDQVVTFGPLIELIAGAEPGTVTSAPLTNGVTTDRFVQELRLTSEAGSRLEWIVGGFYSDEDSNNMQRLVGQPIDFVAADGEFPSTLEEYAGFGNLTYYIVPEMDFTVGARLAKVETSVLLNEEAGYIVQPLPRTSDRSTIDTYLFAWRYRPIDTLSIYARVASGYRPASANLPVLDQATGLPVVEPIIESDTLWSYEAGAKGNILGGAVSYDLAAWLLEWRDLQAVVHIDGVMTGGNADSDVTAYGFEASMGVENGRGLSIDANASYTSSTLDDDETSAFGALAGERMPGLPRWTGSLSFSYENPSAKRWNSFIGGGLRYVGKQSAGFKGGTGQNGEIITPLIADIPLDSYLVADAHAGVRIDNLRISLYAKNLFNEYALTSASARPVLQGFVATGSVLQPRSVGIAVSTHF